jgi:hypothetical protein
MIIMISPIMNVNTHELRMTVDIDVDERYRAQGMCTSPWAP